MAKVIDYYNPAHELVKILDYELVAFFNEYITYNGGIELQTQMAKWITQAKEYPVYDGKLTILNYVWYILSSENATQAKEPRFKYREKRRKARQYWYSIIKKEKASGYAEGLLRDDCTSYFERLRITTNNDIKRYSSEEEYLSQRFKEVSAWGSDTNSNLIAFPYIMHLKDKKIAEYVFLDFAYKVFENILTKYSGDVIHGYITHVDPLSNEGVFSYSPQKKKMEPEIRGNSVRIVDNINDKYSTIVEQVDGDFTNSLLAGTQNELIAQMLDSGQITLENDVLDSDDQKIYNKIFNQFSIEDLNSGLKSISLLSLVKTMYNGKPRRENYVKVLEHLKRLAKYRVEVKTTNAAGEIVSGGIISFFDLIFKTGAEDDNVHTDVTIIDGSSQKDILEELADVEDLSLINIDVMPSQFFKARIRSDMTIKILSSIIDDEMPGKVQAMLILLMSERAEIYPQTKCSIPYATIVSKLRIEESRKKRMKESIKSSIDYLYKRKKVVENYSMGEYVVEIDFFPMSEIEQQSYKLKSGNMISVNEESV